MHSVKLSHVVTSMKHWSVLKGHTFFYPVIRNFIWIRLFRIISIPSKTVFSSVKPHDFDGMLGTGLPVSMYTTKTPIEKCCFNVTQLKEFFTFSVKDRYQLNKLFYLYQRLQCTDNYFFKIKFVLFLYLLLSASWKENNLSWYISVIRQTVGYQTPVFTQPFSWRLHITITYNLPHLWLWYVDVVTIIVWTPEVVCLTFQTSWHEKDGTWSELTWFETTVLIILCLN